MRPVWPTKKTSAPIRKSAKGRERDRHTLRPDRLPDLRFTPGGDDVEQRDEGRGDRRGDQEQHGEKAEPVPAHEDQYQQGDTAGDERAATLGEEGQLEQQPSGCQEQSASRPVDLRAGREGDSRPERHQEQRCARVLVSGRCGEPVSVEGLDAFGGERKPTDRRGAEHEKPEYENSLRSAPAEESERRVDGGVKQRSICTVPCIALHARPRDREEAPSGEGREQRDRRPCPRSRSFSPARADGQDSQEREEKERSRIPRRGGVAASRRRPPEKDRNRDEAERKRARSAHTVVVGFVPVGMGATRARSGRHRTERAP